MSVLTPNMNLIESTIGSDSGLSWEQNLNASLDILDGHNHSPGSGLQINPSGIYINSTLAFNSNPATALAYVNFTAQGGSVPAPIDLSVYSSGGELFYLDGSGNAVQITKTGSVNATSSGISSGTATASFVSSVLVVNQSVGVGAAIDAATYVLRYNGSYPSPSGNYIALQAPASLSSPYAITFPATTPATSGAFITSNTSGNLSYTNVDNSTLQIVGGVLSVIVNSIQPTGVMLEFGGTTAPTGWLMCDGALVSRTTYAALFSIIGTSNGSGDGSTTFALPDHRGRFTRVVDGSAGRDPNAASRTAGATGGNTGNNVGSVQTDDFKSHRHGLLWTAAGSSTPGGIDAGTNAGSSDGAVVQLNGGSETRPINIYVNKIIKT